ncbi:MAG TPA: DUF6046 domain-containing protein [Bacteroidales bacterium]|nr:DUF6046 domain-containing protein [Bacteroidales bacterium]HSA43599.1 DUF6046 domain-containing protein [Bacteroidales bacterium]
MELKYNIPDLIRGFHGTSGKLLFYPGFSILKTERQLLENYPEVQILSHDDLLTEKCYLGTPVFFPVVFEGGQYQIYHEGTIAKVTLEDFRLPLASMVSFRRQKRSTETPLGGGTGVVTETYAIGDWQVDISGLCLDEPQHPHGADTFLKQHKRLLEFENLVDAIKVKGDLFTVKGIYSLKINDISFQPNMGKPRVLSYTMSCSSVTPVELIIK